MLRIKYIFGSLVQIFASVYHNYVELNRNMRCDIYILFKKIKIKHHYYHMNYSWSCGVLLGDWRERMACVVLSQQWWSQRRIARWLWQPPRISHGLNDDRATWACDHIRSFFSPRDNEICGWNPLMNIENGVETGLICCGVYWWIQVQPIQYWWNDLWNRTCQCSAIDVHCFYRYRW